MKSLYVSTSALFGFFVLELSILTGCPPTPPGPSPMPPDAQDGAPFVPTPPDASPGTPCQAACGKLSALGCPALIDCVTVYAHVEGAKEKRTPSGALLTCMMVADAQSKADIVKLGISCP